MRQLPSTEFDLDALQQAAEEASLALANARNELAEAENRAAETRRNLATARSEQQELSVLAEVALRHLGERCPVCQQTYDREATREHLNSLLRIIDYAADPPDVTTDLARIAEHVEQMENAASAVQRPYRTLNANTGCGWILKKGFASA